MKLNPAGVRSTSVTLTVAKVYVGALKCGINQCVVAYILKGASRVTKLISEE